MTGEVTLSAVMTTSGTQLARTHAKKKLGNPAGSAIAPGPSKNAATTTATAIALTPGRLANVGKLTMPAATTPMASTSNQPVA